MSTMTSTAEEKLATLERRLIDKATVARKLSVSLRTVDRLNVPGRVTLKSRVLFDEAMVHAWIAAGCK